MCTKCVRRDILERIPLDAIGLHIFWPFIFCYRELPQFVYSFIKELGVKRGWISPLTMGYRDCKKENWRFAVCSTLLTAVICLAISTSFFVVALVAGIAWNLEQ